MNNENGVHVEHDVKRMTITPESSISVGLLILVIGFIVGGVFSYGVMTSKIDNQGDQLKENTQSIKDLTKIVSDLSSAYSAQVQINKTTSDSLSDIKSDIKGIRTDINVIRKR